MLKPMAQGFANCLSTLAADELTEMKQALNLPRSFVNDLDQRKKAPNTRKRDHRR
jgi:hypothetical protein